MSKKKSNSTKPPAPGTPSDDAVPTPPRVRRPCVVLAPAEHVLDQAFLMSLEGQGLTPRLEHDPQMAMAEVCLLRREARQRATQQSEAADMPPLILIDPTQPHTANMVVVLQRLIPDIPIYVVDEHGAICLESSPDETTPTDQAEPPMVIQPRRDVEVTDQELSVLLGGDPPATVARGDA
jgi:hypothetical protein